MTKRQKVKELEKIAGDLRAIEMRYDEVVQSLGLTEEEEMELGSTTCFGLLVDEVLRLRDGVRGRGK